MSYYKVFADGSFLDIILADSPEEAIEIAKMRHGDGARFTYRPYP